MCDALHDLYQEVILDHGRKPRNYHKMENAAMRARGDNPMCGDRVELFLRLQEDRIAEASFVGRGCAVSIASASLLTEEVVGLDPDAAGQLAIQFEAMARSGQVPPGANLSRLAPLSGVHEFPSRVKCATLPWVTLQAALAGSKEASSE